jgi:hypothetical protein
VFRIAHDCGFPSNAAFAKAFRQQFDSTRPHIEMVERYDAGQWRGWLALPVKKGRSQNPEKQCAEVFRLIHSGSRRGTDAFGHRTKVHLPFLQDVPDGVAQEMINSSIIKRPRKR